MDESQPWYVEQRAEALALVYLTRRPDLALRKEQENDAGLDFVVELVDKGQPARRVFGVQLKGMLSLFAPVAIDSLDSKSRCRPALEQLPFPVCLILFDVKNNVGLYKWLTQPLITEEGAPKLRLNTDGELKRLDTGTLDSIVTEVNHWYDALVTVLAA